MTDMTISTRGTALILEFEGFFPKPYLCPAGVPTIGYGTTQYPDGRKVTLADPAITQGQAVEFFADEARKKADAVSHMVKVPLTQGQFDALVSLAYNIGVGALAKSTLMRLLNAGDYDGAHDQFAVWRKGGGVVLHGLVRRRAAEAKMFAGAA